MQTETSATPAAVDTNEEYIASGNVKKQPAVLTSVFRSIFIETPKDFFGGIIGFFARYIRHFIDGFKYFWKPSLKLPPFEDKDFKEDCQRTFELTILVTAALIFMMKMGWIPSHEMQMELYGNDVAQMLAEAYFFLVFGVAYLLLVLVTVVVGRILRFAFRPTTTRHETDILFTYLNNSLFSITAIAAFLFRTGIKAEQVEEDEVFQMNVLAIYVLLFTPLVITWSIRFARLNGITGFRSFFFVLLASFLFILFFSLSSFALTFVILGT